MHCLHEHFKLNKATSFRRTFWMISWGLRAVEKRAENIASSLAPQSTISRLSKKDDGQGFHCFQLNLAC